MNIIHLVLLVCHPCQFWTDAHAAAAPKHAQFSLPESTGPLCCGPIRHRWSHVIPGGVLPCSSFRSNAPPWGDPPYSAPASQLTVSHAVFTVTHVPYMEITFLRVLTVCNPYFVSISRSRQYLPLTGSHSSHSSVVSHRCTTRTQKQKKTALCFFSTTHSSLLYTIARCVPAKQERVIP